jgi:hypothetical protein
MRRHLHDMLNDCFDRDWSSRPSASELLEYPYILNAPGDHLMRHGTFESATAGSSRSLNGSNNEIFGSGRWQDGGDGSSSMKHQDVDDIGLRVESNYDDDEQQQESAWLGTGLLESKDSLGNMSSNDDLATKSLVRAKSIAMNNDIQSFCREKADDYEQAFSETFNPKMLGTPPTKTITTRGGFFEESDDDDNNPFGSGNNPFASSSDMFDKTFSS